MNLEDFALLSDLDEAAAELADEAAKEEAEPPPKAAKPKVKKEKPSPEKEARKRAKKAKRKEDKMAHELLLKLRLNTAKPRFHPLVATNFVSTARTHVEELHHSNEERKDEFKADFNLPVIAAMCGRHKAAVFTSSTSRLLDPHVTISLFHTGKVVTTGAKTPKGGVVALAQYFAQLGKRLGIKGCVIRYYNYEIQNAVGFGGLGKLLDLEAFAADHSDMCFYVPGLFQGLRYKLPDSFFDSSRSSSRSAGGKQRKMYIVLFASGMYLVTGGRDESELQCAFATISERLQDYCEGGKKYQDRQMQRLLNKFNARLRA
jgi:TATA-box binding protein (TBP) (component of TFIID and TFIIIB)